jgi:hypothetical protein
LFAASLTAFDRSLGPAQAVLNGIRRSYPGAPVAYTERLPGYLLPAEGLRLLTPPGSRRRSRTATSPPRQMPWRWTSC